MWTSFANWLLEQAPVVTVCGMWVISLHLLLSRSSKRIQQLETRNAALSDSLVEVVQSNARERSERVTLQLTNLESLLKTAFDTLLRALESRPRALLKRSPGS